MLQAKEPLTSSSPPEYLPPWNNSPRRRFGWPGSTGVIMLKSTKLYLRPVEVDYLLGILQRQRKNSGWRAEVLWDRLVTIMTEADIKMLDDALSGRLISDAE